MNSQLEMAPMGVEEDPQDSDPLLQGTHSSPSLFSSLNSNSEITNDDVETGSLPCCRICLECDGERDDELISPCMCKGTQQFVHRHCLDHWRSVKEGFAFSHCTTCRAQFHLRVEEVKDNSWRKIKFRVFVARDVFLVFMAVQTSDDQTILNHGSCGDMKRGCSFIRAHIVAIACEDVHFAFRSATMGRDLMRVIAVIGGFAYVMDKDGTFRKSFSASWDHILSGHPIPFYYCLGVLGFLVLLGFLGLVMHCSLNTNDQRLAGCQNCCYGCGILDCFPASMEACFILAIVFIVLFTILGIAYGFLAATMGIQRIWQRHYHILTKMELTQEYIVEDLGGSYTTPELDPVHEARLKMLKLL